jgi:hypothetical protein
MTDSCGEVASNHFEPLAADPEANARLRFIFCGALVTTAIFAVVAVSIVPQPASAVPSFARQTGQPCAACHTAFPELTPYGRRFKLSGYTLGGGDSTLPNVAAMVLPTFTHTAKGQDSPPAPDTNTNDNFLLQQASLFYGGQIYGNLGAFIQVTYDRASQRIFLDNTDIRYADTGTLLGEDLIYGITVNNSPTVQDVWNTTPAWGFPEISSSIAPEFAPPGTMIEGEFAGQVAGAGAYTFWNDMLYLEMSGYQTLSKQTLETLGEPDVGSSSAINGIAPYWRVALEPTWGNNSLMVGTFGMLANIVPGRVSGFGVDQILDVGVDSQYQYNGDMNSFTLKVSDIFERQRLGASYVLGNSTNLNDWLRSFKISGSWVYDHTYSLSAGLFDVAGSADSGLYSSGALFGTPMGNGTPNGRGLIFDVAYMPFSHGGPAFWPWANARIGVSYTDYLKLYGGTTNFDGLGHNAQDNNTVLVYALTAF